MPDHPSVVRGSPRAYAAPGPRRLQDSRKGVLVGIYRHMGEGVWAAQQAKFDQFGIELQPSASSEQFSAILKAEYARYAKVIDEADIRD